MQISAATPEYLPPEVLIFLEKSFQMGDKQKDALKSIQNNSNSWSIDVWALGVIIIEIISGFPLWLQFKTKMVTAQGKNNVGKGAFAVKDRNPLEIVAVQNKFIGSSKRAFVNNLALIDKYNLTKIPELMDLLFKMVSFQPKQRISPKDIIAHPFCVQFGGLKWFNSFF